jgi:ABC-type bacteriocin/lantibiotic exporter with double-glycine peptidase domain
MVGWSGLSWPVDRIIQRSETAARARRLGTEHEEKRLWLLSLFFRKACSAGADPKPTRVPSRVAQAFSPYTWQIVLVMLAILLTTVLDLVDPFLIKFIVDDAIGKRTIHLLILFVSIMLLLPILTGIIGVGQTYLNTSIGQRVMRDFQNKLYVHLQSLSLRFFTATRTGEIQSRLSTDVGGVEDVVPDTATSLVTNIATARQEADESTDHASGLPVFQGHRAAAHPARSRCGHHPAASADPRPARADLRAILRIE